MPAVILIAAESDLGHPPTSSRDYLGHPPTSSRDHHGHPPTSSRDYPGHPWSMYGGCMLPENTNRAIARITLPSFSKHPVIKCCVFPARACVWCVAGLKVLKTSSYCPGFENSNPASFIQTELHIVAQADNSRAWLGLGPRKGA